MALSGCAGWLERSLAGARSPHPTVGNPQARGPVPPAGAPVRCQGGPFPSNGVERHQNAVRIGPLIFADLAYPYSAARFVRGAPPLTVPTIVPPHTSVLIEVPPEARSVVGLDSGAAPATTPDSAHAAVACRTGPSERIFDLSFAVSGARCAPIAVTTHDGGVTTTVTRRVGFGFDYCGP